MNGKISSYKIEPSKYFYAISKGGDYLKQIGVFIIHIKGVEK